MRHGTEKGAIDLVVAAVALPILLLCLAAILDLSRVPLVKSHVSHALRTAAQAPYVPSPSPSGTPASDSVPPLVNMPILDFSSKVSYLIPEDIHLQESEEALKARLADLAAKVRQEFLEAPGIAGLVNPIAPNDLFVQFSIVSLGRGAATGNQAQAIETIAKSDPPPLDWAADLPTVNIDELRDRFALSFRESSGAGGGAKAEFPPASGVWSCDNRFIPPRTTSIHFCPSIWLFGLAHVKIRYLVGGFFGGERMATSYIVLPFKGISKI